MPPLPALTVHRGKVQRSRQMIGDSRVLITSAQGLIAASRQSLARQRYLRIVCAWCQETIRFARAAGTVWGQRSHSICYDCFAHVFWELDPSTTPPPLSPQATARDRPSHGLQLCEDPRRAGGADPMTGRARYRRRLTPPADTALTPRTLNEGVTLP